MNKTAIITGGGRGIGWAITEKLAQDGYDTAVLGSSDPARYSKTIEQLEKCDIKYKYTSAYRNRSSGKRRSALWFGILAGFMCWSTMPVWRLRREWICWR